MKKDLLKLLDLSKEDILKILNTACLLYTSDAADD